MLVKTLKKLIAFVGGNEEDNSAELSEADVLHATCIKHLKKLDVIKPLKFRNVFDF